MDFFEQQARAQRKTKVLVWYFTLAVISLVGVAALVWIGIQPPNEKALPVTAITIALLVVSWFLVVKKNFKGPPTMDLSAKPLEPIAIPSEKL